MCDKVVGGGRPGCPAQCGVWPTHVGGPEAYVAGVCFKRRTPNEQRAGCVGGVRRDAQVCVCVQESVCTQVTVVLSVHACV